MKFKNRVKTSVTKLENMPTRIQDQPVKGRKSDISKERETRLSTPTLSYPWKSLLRDWAFKQGNASSSASSEFPENGAACVHEWPKVLGTPGNVFTKGEAVHQ